MKHKIELLRSQLTLNPSKVFGIDTPPVGLSVSPTMVVNNGYSGDLQGWDFNGRGFMVNVPMGTVRGCLLRQTFLGGMLYLVNVGLNGSVAFDGCTFRGMVGGVGAAINALNTGTGMDFRAGDLRGVRYSQFLDLPQDHIKVLGSITGPQVFEWNYHAPPVSLPYPPSLWDPAKVYAPGDLVYSPVSGKAFVYRSIMLGGAPPITKISNAFWRNVDLHADVYTSVAGVGDIIVQHNLIEWISQPTNLGVNNPFRISRNTGTIPPVNGILIQENVLYTSPDSASYPIQVLAGLETNFNGPIRFLGNWMQSNRNGSFFHPSSNGWVDAWDNNRHTTTDALIQGPTLRMPK